MFYVSSFAGLNFGPQWMRNPPPAQQETTYPQRQFPLAQFRYGREEMLAIFEQIAGQHPHQHHELEPAQLGDVPPDFPEMSDGFQVLMQIYIL